MSGARHKRMKFKAYDAKGSGVEKEAMEKKHGGKVMKEVDMPKGGKSKARMDKRPRKASGGRVSPWSSAHSG